MIITDLIVSCSAPRRSAVKTPSLCQPRGFSTRYGFRYCVGIRKHAVLEASNSGNTHQLSTLPLRHVSRIYCSPGWIVSALFLSANTPPIRSVCSCSFAASAAEPAFHIPDPRPAVVKDTGINVGKYVQEHYTPYAGDSTFLAAPTEKTKALWAVLEKVCCEELQKGIMGVDPHVPSTITAFGPGYIDKRNEVVVGLQTDAPLKRAIKPLGGINMVKAALQVSAQEAAAAAAGATAWQRQQQGPTVSTVQLISNPGAAAVPYLGASGENHEWQCHWCRATACTDSATTGKRQQQQHAVLHAHTAHGRSATCT